MTTAGALWWFLGSDNALTKSHPDCILVFPRDPYADWARATRTYLKEKYDVRAELEELHENDPERDEVVLSILSTEAKAIIPFEVNVTEFIASEMGNRTILCRNSSTISNLNHKAKQISMLSSPSIPQIPTLDLETCSASQLCDFVSKTNNSKFIVKPSRGAGSLHQKVLTKDEVCGTMARLISNKLWKKPAVIQPLIESKYSTIEFNLFVDNDEDLVWIATHSPGGLSEKNWEDGVILYPYEDKEDLEQILSFVKSMIQRHELRGLLEFEFLKNHENDELFLLEVNPRISSSIVAFDAEGNSPYIDRLLVPYIRKLGVDVRNPAPSKDSSSSSSCKVWFPPELSAESYVKEQWCNNNGRSR